MPSTTSSTPGSSNWSGSASHHHPTRTSTGNFRETDAAFDGHAPMRISMPNGDVYWHRYVHDSYGESNTDGSGWDDG